METRTLHRGPECNEQPLLTSTTHNQLFEEEGRARCRLFLRMDFH